MLSMEAEAGGNHQEGQWGGVGSGSLPEDEGYGDPTDIYGKCLCQNTLLLTLHFFVFIDCVDEMDVEQHPPPLGLPPQGNGFQAPPPSYPPGQEFEDQVGAWSHVARTCMDKCNHGSKPEFGKLLHCFQNFLH